MNIFSAKKKEIVWFMCKFNYKCSIYKNGVDLKQVVHLIKKLSIGIVKKKKKKKEFFLLFTYCGYHLYIAFQKSLSVFNFASECAYSFMLVVSEM